MEVLKEDEFIEDSDPEAPYHAVWCEWVVMYRHGHLGQPWDPSYQAFKENLLAGAVRW